MSGQQTPALARVIDPILSEHARGYRQAQLVAMALFPMCFVPAYGGKVIEFGKESFRLYNSKRAPGSATKRIRFGYEGKPYAIVPSALEAQVPRELGVDAAAVPGINLATRAVNLVLRARLLEQEYDCAQIARNADNYDSDHKVNLSSTARWTHEDSDPAGDISDGAEAIRESIGMTPNTLLLSARAARALRRHPQLIGRVADNATRVVTLDTLRQVFEVDNIVIGAATVADDSDALGDVWGTDAILAYVAPGSAADANNEEPSYGYTYAIDGMPLVEEPYWDNSTKSWVYGVSHDATPVLSGMTAGYLIQNAGAAHS
jgi:hypothetical protein